MPTFKGAKGSFLASVATTAGTRVPGEATVVTEKATPTAAIPGRAGRSRGVAKPMVRPEAQAAGPRKPATHPGQETRDIRVVAGPGGVAEAMPRGAGAGVARRVVTSGRGRRVVGVALALATPPLQPLRETTIASGKARPPVGPPAPAREGEETAPTGDTILGPARPTVQVATPRVAVPGLPAAPAATAVPAVAAVPVVPEAPGGPMGASVRSRRLEVPVITRARTAAEAPVAEGVGAPCGRQADLQDPRDDAAMAASAGGAASAVPPALVPALQRRPTAVMATCPAQVVPALVAVEPGLTAPVAGAASREAKAPRCAVVPVLLPSRRAPSRGKATGAPDGEVEAEGVDLAPASKGHTNPVLHKVPWPLDRRLPSSIAPTARGCAFVVAPAAPDIVITRVGRGIGTLRPLIADPRRNNMAAVGQVATSAVMGSAARYHVEAAAETGRSPAQA